MLQSIIFKHYELFHLNLIIITLSLQTQMLVNFIIFK